MKSAILAAAVAVAVGGFASSSYAQDVKKLDYHPAAAMDASSQRGSVDLPAATVSQPGATAASDPAKPMTGNSAAAGEMTGNSTAVGERSVDRSKQNN
jgi:hypothetical protein